MKWPSEQALEAGLWPGAPKPFRPHTTLLCGSRVCQRRGRPPHPGHFAVPPHSAPRELGGTALKPPSKLEPKPLRPWRMGWLRAGAGVGKPWGKGCLRSQEGRGLRPPAVGMKSACVPARSWRSEGWDALSEGVSRSPVGKSSTEWGRAAVQRGSGGAGVIRAQPRQPPHAAWGRSATPAIPARLIPSPSLQNSPSLLVAFPLLTQFHFLHWPAF